MSALAATPDLHQQLVELFDMKKAKIRRENILNQQAAEAQRDIRMLSMMFKDGIPDVTVQMGNGECIKWDAHAQKLIYFNGEVSHIVDATPRETRIRIRPYLQDMVKVAKNLYV